MKTLKKTKVVLMVAISLFTLVLGGCEDKGETPVLPQFPELKNIQVAVGDTITLEFETNLDWSFESNKSWCQFLNGEILETTASGSAGSQSLKAVISASDLNYIKADTATLSLSMSNETKEIYKVSRAKKEYKNLELTDVEGNALTSTTPLIIKGDGLGSSKNDIIYTIVKTSADMPVGIKSCPEWLDVEQNVQGEFSFHFNKTNEAGVSFVDRYEKEGEAIVFATQDIIEGKVDAQSDKIREIAVPVIYEGLKDYAIEIEQINNHESESSFIGNNLYLESVSDNEIKTKLYSEDGNIEFGTETPEGIILSYKVKTVRNSQYEPVYFTVKKHSDITQGSLFSYEYGFDVDKNRWFSSSKKGDNEQMTFLISEGEYKPKENEGILVFLFSKDFCNTHRDDMATTILDEKGDIRQEYGSNILVSVVYRESFKFKGYFQEFGSEELKPFGNDTPESITWPATNRLEESVRDALCKIELDGSSNTSFDYELLRHGKVYFEIVGYTPDMIDMSSENEIQGVTRSFESYKGKQYFVISGEPNKMEDLLKNFQIKVGVPDGSFIESVVKINNVYLYSILEYKGFYKANDSKNLIAFGHTNSTSSTVTNLDKAIESAVCRFNPDAEIDGTYTTSFDYELLRNGEVYIEVLGYEKEKDGRGMQATSEVKRMSGIKCSFKKDGNKYFYVISGTPNRMEDLAKGSISLETGFPATYTEILTSVRIKNEYSNE